MGTLSQLSAGVAVFGQARKLAVDEANAKLGEAEEKQKEPQKRSCTVK